MAMKFPTRTHRFYGTHDFRRTDGAGTQSAGAAHTECPSALGALPSLSAWQRTARTKGHNPAPSLAVKIRPASARDTSRCFAAVSLTKPNFCTQRKAVSQRFTGDDIGGCESR